jgi:cobalt-zinc-cadmium efflux system outer membrane protein
MNRLVRVPLRHAIPLALAVIAAAPGALCAQQPVTRAQAISAALAHGPRLPLAAADTAAAHAALVGARQFANPTLTASYSKDVPQHHVLLDVPLDFPWLRRARVGGASAFNDAARARFALERAAVTFDAETTYTTALVAAAHARLSARNAQDADSLLHMARARRDAGDASEMDVQLATVFAGQQANQALTDSLVEVAALLDLQTVMGDSSDRVRVVLADSLDVVSGGAAGGGTPLGVTAAESALRAADQFLAVERRSVFGAPSIQFGFDAHDPTPGGERGVLPTVGLAIPLPLFNQNQGNIAAATAERDRARAELAAARLESARDIAQMTRTRDIALARVARDRTLLESANRVSAMALAAYAEGAVALPAVLEAQRNARETLSQYVDDLGAANVAIAALRMLTASASTLP